MTGFMLVFLAGFVLQCLQHERQLTCRLGLEEVEHSLRETR